MRQVRSRSQRVPGRGLLIVQKCSLQKLCRSIKNWSRSASGPPLFQQLLPLEAFLALVDSRPLQFLPWKSHRSARQPGFGTPRPSCTRARTRSLRGHRTASGRPVAGASNRWSDVESNRRIRVALQAARSSFLSHLSPSQAPGERERSRAWDLGVGAFGFTSMGSSRLAHTHTHTSVGIRYKL